ncbi:MAG: DUF4870 domain-containing protein [Planctomycetaceae bacterium]|nr:DUF4870 domain-containing protein [Planctomycetaceae bacterium]
MTDGTPVDGSPDLRAAWHWSRDGVAEGPVDFTELKRLAAAGVITPSTWVHDPVLRKWIGAASVAGLVFASSGVAGGAPHGMPAAPDAHATPHASAPPFGAAGSAPAMPASPPPVTPPPVAASPIEPKLAEVICRASVLVLPFNYILSPIAVGIVWAIGASDARVVAECRQTMNCLLSIYIVGAAALVVGVVCVLIVIGPFIAAACGAAIFVYCIVVGIQGLVAASQGRPYRYPFAWQLLR